MPDGNEGGANAYWVPGGINSGGNMEAVLNGDNVYRAKDSSNPLFHNNDVSTLEDIFEVN